MSKNEAVCLVTVLNLQTLFFNFYSQNVKFGKLNQLLLLCVGKALTTSVT